MWHCRFAQQSPVIQFTFLGNLFIVHQEISQFLPWLFPNIGIRACVMIFVLFFCRVFACCSIRKLCSQSISKQSACWMQWNYGNDVQYESSAKIESWVRRRLFYLAFFSQKIFRWKIILIMWDERSHWDEPNGRSNASGGSRTHPHVRLQAAMLAATLPHVATRWDCPTRAWHTPHKQACTPHMRVPPANVSYPDQEPDDLTNLWSDPVDSTC